MSLLTAIVGGIVVVLVVVAGVATSVSRKIYSGRATLDFAQYFGELPGTLGVAAWVNVPDVGKVLFETWQIEEMQRLNEQAKEHAVEVVVQRNYLGFTWVESVKLDSGQTLHWKAMSRTGCQSFHSYDRTNHW